MRPKGKTPMRGIRIEEELWRAAMDKADREGRTISDIIRAALKRYVAR